MSLYEIVNGRLEVRSYSALFERESCYSDDQPRDDKGRFTPTGAQVLDMLGPTGKEGENDTKNNYFDKATGQYEPDRQSLHDATVFADQNFTPTIDPRNAAMVKVWFEDGEQVFGYVSEEQRKRLIADNEEIRASVLFRAEDEHDHIIMRHGETPDDVENKWSGWSNVDLTPKGIDDVTTTAKSLIGRGIRYIKTSPVRRARHSAEIVSMMLGNIPIFDDWRLASWRLGILEGEKEADDKIRPYVENPYSLIPGDSESLFGYKTRVLAGITDAEEDNTENGPSITLTHSSGIAMWEGGGDILHASGVLKPGSAGLSHGFGKSIEVLAGAD